ncbi:protein of unknown function DUF1549 [Isosphaera pallida ATCC 43644]|uniref:Cytochrome c domain-containing protein n=1 Tax=Isosphaera pallida (strain ATCC 43644 / DSM 9630 / IS1B) TaxID=575540 RepID=E8R3C1_ISOPI|nr:DUF1549 domain-containing protein [Isosphaera pallida]ADV63631.1 protein of unknown function DUF1549 [Isosphaera pallida ATCC 43644]
MMIRSEATWALSVLIGWSTLTGGAVGWEVRAQEQTSGAAADDFRARQRAEAATLPVVPAPETLPGEHPIDAALRAGRAQGSGLTPPPGPPLTDGRLLRRLSLDLIGLPPTPEEIADFENDPAPLDDKVARAVERLLANRRGYAEHNMTFWSDLLRNDEQTAIDGLRAPITPWLYQALLENKPYDQMVHELLNPGQQGPIGFLKGVNWRGRVNLSQRPEVQAAQNVAQIFLATSIKCASCHDGFTTDWKLKDAYGLAAFFSEGPLEMARCEQPTGIVVAPRFLYEGLGEVAADADLATRRRAVADMVTRPRNQRFARVIVNRLWERYLGRPLAFSLDEMGESFYDELHAWLADDLIRHDYDLLRTTRLIVTSTEYRRAVTPQSRDEAGERVDPAPRRLTVEQFLDALASLTGYWPRIAETFRLTLEGDPIRAWRIRKPGLFAETFGRPNREQVVSRRQEEATLLQALEAVNGRELADLISQGAKTLLDSDLGRESDSAKVVETLFLRGFARMPTAEETAELADLLVPPGAGEADQRREGLEDLLWLIVNHPEFQYLP